MIVGESLLLPFALHILSLILTFIPFDPHLLVKREDSIADRSCMFMFLLRAVVAVLLLVVRTHIHTAGQSERQEATYMMKVKRRNTNNH